MKTRPNGLPALRDLPIKFTRRTATEAATAAFAKLVGKETDRAKYSPHEYASADGRWIIRSVQHSGYGTANNGRARWHVVRDGRYFATRFGMGSTYTISLEDAIDGIHDLIARGVRDGFEVLAQMRRDAEKRERDAEKHGANLARAKKLLDRLCGIDFLCMVEALAEHVDLDKLTRAIEQADRKASC